MNSRHRRARRVQLLVRLRLYRIRHSHDLKVPDWFLGKDKEGLVEKDLSPAAQQKDPAPVQEEPAPVQEEPAPVQEEPEGWCLCSVPLVRRAWSVRGQGDSTEYKRSKGSQQTVRRVMPRMSCDARVNAA